MAAAAGGRRGAGGGRGARESGRGGAGARGRARRWRGWRRGWWRRWRRRRRRRGGGGGGGGGLRGGAGRGGADAGGGGGERARAGPPGLRAPAARAARPRHPGGLPPLAVGDAGHLRQRRGPERLRPGLAALCGGHPGGTGGGRPGPGVRRRRARVPRTRAVLRAGGRRGPDARRRPGRRALRRARQHCPEVRAHVLPLCGRGPPQVCHAQAGRPARGDEGPDLRHALREGVPRPPGLPGRGPGALRDRQSLLGGRALHAHPHAPDHAPPGGPGVGPRGPGRARSARGGAQPHRLLHAGGLEQPGGGERARDPADTGGGVP